MPLTDPSAFEKDLPAIAAALEPLLKARVEAGEVEGTRVWTVHYRLGEGMRFGVVGTHLLVTGGEGAFLRARQRLLSGGPGLSLEPEARKRLATEGALAVVLQMSNALKVLDGLDAQAFGGGPSGIMIASAARRLTAPLRSVREAAAVLEAEEGGLGLRLTVGFNAAPQKAR